MKITKAKKIIDEFEGYYNYWLYNRKAPKEYVEQKLLDYFNKYASAKNGCWYWKKYKMPNIYKITKINEN